jgi:hypothetical protein
MSGRSLFIVVIQTAYGSIVIVWIIPLLYSRHRSTGAQQFQAVTWV